MPDQRNHALAGLPEQRTRTRRCGTCREFVPAGSIVGGECPECAGLIALPLRGAGGRFLSFAPTVERIGPRRQEKAEDAA
jgi:hypothetical protein